MCALWVNRSSKAAVICSSPNTSVHFGNKESLINAVVNSELERIEIHLIELCSSSDNKGTLLENFVNAISSEEQFLSIIYKEFFFLPEIITNRIASMELVLRNIFFNSILNSNCLMYNRCQIMIGLDAFFSTINCYLANKMFNVKKENILNLYYLLFSNR